MGKGTGILMAHLAGMTAVRYGALALAGPTQGRPLARDAGPVLDGLDALAGELRALSAQGVRTETALALLETAEQLLRDAGPATPYEPADARTAQGGLAGWQIRAMTCYIDNNLDSKLSLARLAATVRLSASYLCRAFRHSQQCSPMQYVVQRRLLAAKHLLRHSPAPLSEIALTCGFSDQAHFTRQFRSATGETPQRWRRMWQADGMHAGALRQFGAHPTL